MKKQNVIIYGAGNIGKEATVFLKEHNYTVLFYVDSDKNKIGMRLQNRMIISFEQYLSLQIDVEIIICANENATLEIISKLHNADIYNYRRYEEIKKVINHEVVIPSKDKLAIWGWWQGNNLGDNWIKQINKILFPKAVFIDTTYLDINNFGFVLIGGGGLFIHNVISPWNDEIIVPFGAWGLGAEFPHISDRALELNKKAEFFYTRDIQSYKLMGITNGDYSCDITFTKPIEWNYMEKNINNVLFIWYDEDIRKSELYNRYTNNENFYLECLKILYQKFSSIEVNDFQTSDCCIEEIVRDCGFIISGKYHGIVAAIQRGVPCIAVEMSTKLRDIMNDCGLGEYCITASEIEKLPILIEKAKKEYDTIRQKQYKYRCASGQRAMHCYEKMKKKIYQYVDL